MTHIKICPKNHPSFQLTIRKFPPIENRSFIIPEKYANQTRRSTGKNAPVKNNERLFVNAV